MKRVLLQSGILFVFIGCSHLTVAPKPVVAHTVAMGSTNRQDADVIDGDATGLLVRQAWLDKYRALELKMKELNAIGDERIKAEGGSWRVPYSVSDHFADMRRRERLAEAGP